MQKVKNTNLKNYGCEYVSQNKDIKEKVKNTILEKYGTICVFQNEDIKEKIKITNLEKLGVEYPIQNKDIMQKIKNTNLIKYGYEYPSQNPEYSGKMLKRMHNYKKYVYPSGRIDNIQGYENYGLDHLLHVENINENDIITNRTQVPVIWWQDSSGQNHRYYIDIFIPSQNRGIEIKSKWTMESKLEVNLLKQKAFINNGHIYVIYGCTMIKVLEL